MKRCHAINRLWWDEVTPVHVASEFYDVDGFLSGRDMLGTVEREAVGDVTGKKLLHLQCHFGLDTLCWARAGAKVVGLDFSPAALEVARGLARRCALESCADFIEVDVTEAGRVPGAPFDIVFTSLGAFMWVGDIVGWAATIADNLADDGFFYFLDAHPTALMFDEASITPAVAFDYFHSQTPLFEPGGTPDYADQSYKIRSDSQSFIWSLSDILGALEDAGLAISEFREYPFLAWAMFPDMKRAEDGYFHRAPDSKQLPMMFGFKARREAGHPHRHAERVPR